MHVGQTAVNTKGSLLVGIDTNTNEVPDKFELRQNYSESVQPNT
jgi:hypothetical protein